MHILAKFDSVTAYDSYVEIRGFWYF